MCRDIGVTGQDKRDLIRKFHSNGITNSGDIKKAMNAAANSGYKAGDLDKVIVAAKLKQEATKYGMKKKDIEDRLRGKPGAAEALKLIDML